MPFRSEAQRRFLWSEHPDIAEKWSHKYGPAPVHKDAKPKKPKKSPWLDMKVSGGK